MTTEKTAVILPESDEAAQFKTGLSGWVSRSGRFWGNDERMARYDGSTHRKCECGEIIEQRSYCSKCYEAKRYEKYLAMPVVEWDGVSMVYDENTDEYFDGIDRVIEHYECHEIELADARLVVCKPNYARCIDDDYWSDDLPEDIYFDGVADSKTIELLNELNERLSKLVLSYSPGNGRIDILKHIKD